ncbi:1685_t:CDS:1, partial [Racocetra fulgida]
DERKPLKRYYSVTIPEFKQHLFQYERYITTIDCNLSRGIKTWLCTDKHSKKVDAIEDSLLRMFLRSSNRITAISLENNDMLDEVLCKNIRTVYLNGTIGNKEDMILAKAFRNNVGIVNIEIESTIHETPLIKTLGSL